MGIQRLGFVCAISLLLLLGACGGGGNGESPKEEVLGAVRAYYLAYLDQDGNAICSTLTDSAKRVLVENPPEGRTIDCGAVMKVYVDLLGEDQFQQIRKAQARLSDADVTVSGSAATVESTYGGHLRLVRDGTGWYLDVSSPLELLPMLGNTLDRGKVQSAISKSLERRFKESVVSVECPRSQPVVPETKFACSVHFGDGSESSARVEILNEAGDLSLIGLRAGTP